MSSNSEQRRWCVQILELRSLYVFVEAKSEVGAGERAAELLEDDNLVPHYSEREWWQVGSALESNESATQKAQVRHD